MEPPPTAAALDALSAEALFPQLYTELRRLARSRLMRGGRHTLLDTAVLINEAYLRMRHGGEPLFRDREHFLAYAATAMRHIVIDFIRRRQAQRRGGDVARVTLHTAAFADIPAAETDALAVHEALEELAAVDRQLAHLVELRYFGGLTDAEVAAVMGVTDRTVRRHWERARLLLADMLGR